MHTATLGDSVVQIGEDQYLDVSEVVRRLGISRQTLWRWRQEGKIPQGHRYRGRRVVFSEDEFGEIESFANRLEPIDSVPDKEQLRLFNGGDE